MSEQDYEFWEVVGPNSERRFIRRNIRSLWTICETTLTKSDETFFSIETLAQEHLPKRFDSVYDAIDYLLERGVYKEDIEIGGYICPKCKNFLYNKDGFCRKCSGRLDYYVERKHTYEH